MCVNINNVRDYNKHYLYKTILICVRCNATENAFQLRMHGFPTDYQPQSGLESSKQRSKEAKNSI